MKTYKELIESLEIILEDKPLSSKLASKLEKIYRKFENGIKLPWSLDEHEVNLKPFGEKDFTNGKLTLRLSGVDANKDKQQIDKLIKVVEQSFKKFGVKLDAKISGVDSGSNPERNYSLIFTGLNTENKK